MKKVLAVIGITLVLILTVLCIDHTSLRAAEAPTQGGDIVFTKPVKSVLFSHKAHVEGRGIACEECHSKIFEMKALKTQEKSDFTMDSIYKGKYCGACHNGKTAFSANSQCSRCHDSVRGLAGLEKTSKFTNKPPQGPKGVFTIGSGSTAVQYSHEAHKFWCSECHPKHFKIQRKSTTITFADHSANRFCYACHNGERAFNWNECTKCHGRNVAPAAKLVFGKGETAVRFSHEAHRDGCSTCHTNIFKMKKGFAKITIADHGTDRFCYTCHNGKKAFAYTECAKCHGKSPAPQKPLAYKPDGAAPVSFNHVFHAGAFGCSECHPKLFVMKKGGSKMKMDGMYQDKFCGACHNDKMAFGVMNCDKCHK